ncbi:MAG: helix-turn-helix domain-containing protein [Xanthobacteraceae bacterium]
MRERPTLSIGELSRLTDVNIETIRYYEKVGVLPAPSRTGSGRRIYGSRETRTLAFIRRSRELGFTLDEVRALLNLGAPANATCAQVREIAGRHLKDIQGKIADLTKLESLLNKTIKRCSGRAVPECPVIDVLDVRRRNADA